MKYSPGSIVSLDVFRLIGRCNVAAGAETSILFPADRARSRHSVISDTYFSLVHFEE